MARYLKKIDARHYRTLLFCGDIHGRFDLLQAALARKGFVAEQDLLVLVGDLIDRGRFCPETVSFVLAGLKQGCIVMVAGNHDLYPVGDYAIWMANDGDWFEHLKKQEPDKATIVMQQLVAIAEQPLALELHTEQGLIGIVHGDVPENDWLTLSNTADAEQAPRLQRTLVSGRSMLKAKQLNALASLHVANIDYVVSGHTVVQQPLFVANRAYIDTGAYYTEQLTLLSLPELVAGFKNSRS
ncbi:metallophosphoesterase [Rheinheimera sp. UJ63]|uniref:metallophosphoesterase n=1 Tax=Rheinheimera sp. UJ63 TaxID=2910157 RepID=UPI001F2D1807|nr:metallophosphoesterase [Rheinheimera sp. UJ63]MCF4009585.1 metallophosphoesterase [Rheinheimera sp. UJ63]